MTISILLPLIVCLIGVVVYFASVTNAKLAEVGRLMFTVGLLVTLLDLPTHVVHF